MLNKNVEKNICIMFPENAEDRTQRILKRLRDDKAKDHHVPGSLTWIGRCAVDNAAADLIEQLESRVPRWISVDERLPEVSAENNGYQITDMVLATTAGYICFGFFEIFKYNGTWEFVSVDTDLDQDRSVTITHWMPLPEPPVKEEHQE